MLLSLESRPSFTICVPYRNRTGLSPWVECVSRVTNQITNGTNHLQILSQQQRDTIDVKIDAIQEL